MELIFRQSKHFLHSIVDTNDNESQTPISTLKVLHQPLIVRNVSIANRIQNIHRIKVPSKCSTTLKLLQDNFSAIDVEEYEVDEDEDKEDIKSNDSNSSNDVENNSPAPRSHNIPIKENMDYLEIPLNSAIRYQQSEKEKKNLNKSNQVSLGPSLCNSKDFARGSDASINITKCINIQIDCY